MINYVLTRLDINRIQVAYEQSVIKDNDSTSWNNSVKECGIDPLMVFRNKIFNSSIGIFSGIDSIGNKVIILDTNSNNDFAYEEVYSVPPSLRT